MIKVLRAKLHGIRVTSADLDYHGSITLDPEHCEAAGIYPLEFGNKNSGARISTYVVFGDRGSRCCILNGAAARTCQIGDHLIIAASEYIDRMTLGDFDPVVLTFHSDNSIDKQLLYRVRPTAAAKYGFSIEPRQRAPGHNGGGRMRLIALRATQVAAAWKASIKVRSEAADAFAANVGPIIKEIQASGVSSLRGVARALTARGIRSPRGRDWSDVQVAAVLRR